MAKKRKDSKKGGCLGILFKGLMILIVIAGGLNLLGRLPGMIFGNQAKKAETGSSAYRSTVEQSSQATSSPTPTQTRSQSTPTKKPTRTLSPTRQAPPATRSSVPTVAPTERRTTTAQATAKTNARSTAVPTSQRTNGSGMGQTTRPATNGNTPAPANKVDIRPLLGK